MIYLIDRNKEMCSEWEKSFKDDVDVSVVNDDFFSKKVDCIVSPANSFGFMDGGLDGAITRKFGNIVQTRVQKAIKENFGGELLVGQALLVETGNVDTPFCMSAPTMRVPMILDKSHNVYLATRAIFILLKSEQNKIKSIAISGLGTGVGRVPFNICARQMKQAYNDVILGKYEFPKTWDEIQTRDQLLYSSNVRDLQFRN